MTHREDFDGRYDTPRLQPCGECRACCYVFPLNDKPTRKWCQHSQPGIGCACYEQRPQVCRGYQCQWRGSELPIDYRPDKCGLIGTFRFAYCGHPVVVISEVWPGAAETALGKDLIAIMMAAGKIVCVCFCDERSWLWFRHVGLPSEDGPQILDQLCSDTTAGLEKQRKMGFTFGSPLACNTRSS